MTPQELHDRFRSEVQDEAEPYLWTEDEVWAYLKWAHQHFVRLMGGIVDSSSSITTLPAVTDEEFAAYDSRILKIRFARRLSDDKPIAVIDFSDLGKYAGDDYGLAHEIELNSDTGVIRAMITVMEEHKVRWVSIPSADDTVQMTVVRLPICTLDGSDGEAFEIREEWHEYLLDGMKHRAHLKQDGDTLGTEDMILCTTPSPAWIKVIMGYPARGSVRDIRIRSSPLPK